MSTKTHISEKKEGFGRISVSRKFEKFRLHEKSLIPKKIVSFCEKLKWSETLEIRHFANRIDIY